MHQSKDVALKTEDKFYLFKSNIYLLATYIALENKQFLTWMEQYVCNND